MNGFDHIFDFEMSIGPNAFGTGTANGTNTAANANSNNPSSASYNPESLRAPNTFDPSSSHTGTALYPGALTSPQHHHHLLSTNGTQGNAAYALSGNNSPYRGNSSTSAAAVAAANAAILASTAGYDPVTYRHQHASLAATRQSPHQTNLDDFFMMAPPFLQQSSAVAAPSSTAPSAPICSSSSATVPAAFDPLMLAPEGHVASKKADMTNPEEEFLSEIEIQVPSLSLEPMKGTEVVRRIRQCMEDVIRRYIPCVDFLVQCQQDLRKGLAYATQKQRVGSRRYYQQTMTSRQFWQTYIDHLPNRFLLSNQRMMEQSALQQAVEGLQKLRSDAKNACAHGSESVKNTFLGGMKEGESWGLRRWLSKNGNALRVCTDLECILKACKALDKTENNTKKMAKLLRPIAKETLTKLKNDIPASYQERSTAHPYLPFFHRLEAALRDMSQFDPEDDGVILLDDSDDDDDDPVIIEAPPPPPPPPTRKRKAPPKKSAPKNPPKRNRPSEPAATKDDASSSGESDTESVIEVIGVKPPRGQQTKDATEWVCALCNHENKSASTMCEACGAESFQEMGLSFENLDAEIMNQITKKKAPSKKKQRDDLRVAVSHLWPSGAFESELENAAGIALSMARKVERLADYFDQLQSTELPHHVTRARKANAFWDSFFGDALRIFMHLLDEEEIVHFVDPVDDADLASEGFPSYSSVIKTPLCLRNIIDALFDVENINEDEAISDDTSLMNGSLSKWKIPKWNMWRGSELLQAIDLVFLQSLAYGKSCGEGRSKQRSRTNELRKKLWNSIHTLIATHYPEDAERRKQSTPTRRSETSGFVINKEGGRSR